MKYVAPLGSINPEGNYIDPVDGTVPAAAIEQPMREIASVIASMGIVPSQSDLTQLDQAIDLKVAAVQPDLGTFVTRDELAGYREEMAKYQEEFARYVKKMVVSEKYDLCEFYYFRNPVLRPGFMPARGKVLENAALRYPHAWEYLQTCEGQKLCVPEEDWQAMSRAVFATLADGTEIGWEGVGGVPFFAPDIHTGNLRLPDLRGMYAEAAGFDSLEVGGAHGDEVKCHTHQLRQRTTGGNLDVALSGPGYANGYYADAHDVGYRGEETLAHGGSSNRVRAWGALACVYLGIPAS